MRHTRYAHDCVHCTYAGSGTVGGVWVDCYFCNGPPSSSLGGSIIVRYGARPEAYFSAAPRIAQMMADAGDPYASIGLISTDRLRRE